MNINDLKQKKQELRQELKNTRSSISPELRRLYSQQISTRILAQQEIIDSDVIFIYISYASEVETHDLISDLLDLGKILAVPKILSSNKMISVKFTDWDDLKKAELGILTPKSIEPMQSHFDVCITPGLGFTTAGKRIGFGAGYYDRWFSENSVAKKIALTYEAQVVDDIPTDEYDQLVDKVITEQRVIDTDS